MLCVCELTLGWCTFMLVHDVLIRMGYMCFLCCVHAMCPGEYITCIIPNIDYGGLCKKRFFFLKKHTFFLIPKKLQALVSLGMYIYIYFFFSFVYVYIYMCVCFDVHIYIYIYPCICVKMMMGWPYPIYHNNFFLTMAHAWKLMPS